jgi:septal ring factor EnvC (AmiA/AmiB activator)
MNNDEQMKRQMESILKQQAQWDANMARMEEKHAQIQEKHAQLQDIVGRLAITTTAGLEAFVDAQIKTEAKIFSLTEKMTALAEAQTQTDGRLSILTNVVERQKSEGRNGGPEL